MAVIDRDSQEIRTFTVGAVDTSGTTVDITADSVDVAFVPQGTRPATGDWKTCSRDPDVSTLVAVKFGLSGGFTLDPGSYARFVRITDSPEVPILPCKDILTVT
jgi:hypothetical protein